MAKQKYFKLSEQKLNAFMENYPDAYEFLTTRMPTVKDEDNEEWITPGEASKRTGLSKQTLRRLANNGTAKAKWDGRGYLYFAGDLPKRQRGTDK